MQSVFIIYISYFINSLSEKILRIADNNKNKKNSHDQSEIAPKFSDGLNEVGVSYAPLSIF